MIRNSPVKGQLDKGRQRRGMKVTNILVVLRICIMTDTSLIDALQRQRCKQV